MSKLLEKEFQFFIDHQEELVEKYNGKVLVIKNEKVIGTYDSELDALIETKKDHEEGTFLIQKCESGSDVYTATFHSRVAFA